MRTQRRSTKTWMIAMIAIMLAALANTAFLTPFTQAYANIYGEEPWLQSTAEAAAIAKDQQVMYFGVVKEATAAGYVVEAINMEIAYSNELYGYDQDASLIDVVVRDHTDIVTLNGARTLDVQTPVVVAGYRQPDGRVEALVLGDMQAADLIEPETAGDSAIKPPEPVKPLGEVGILSAAPASDKRYTTIEGDFSKSFTWKKNVPAFKVGSLLTVSLYFEIFSGVEMNWNFPFEVETRLLDPIRYISWEELGIQPGETAEERDSRLHALKAMLRVDLEPLKQQKNRTLFAEAGVRLSLGFEGSIMGTDFNERIDLLKLASGAAGVGAGLHMQVGGKHAAPLFGKQATFGIREQIGLTEDAVKCTTSCTVDLFTEDSIGIGLPFFESGVFTMGFIIQPLMLVYGDSPKIRQIEATPGLEVEAIYQYDLGVNHGMAFPVSENTPIYPEDALLLHVRDMGSGPPAPDDVFDLSFRVDYNPQAMVGFLYQATMSAKKFGLGAEVRLPMMALPIPFDFDLNAISGTGPAELSCTTKELTLTGCTAAAFQFPASSIIQPIALATTELPDAVSGIPYESGEIETYGGVGELTLKTVGLLPGGLKLVKTDGAYRLRGIPKVKEGRYTIKLQVSDREGKKREFELPLRVGKIYPERIDAELIPGQLWSERLRLVEADGRIADDAMWRLEGDLPSGFYELDGSGMMRTVPAELAPGEYSFRAIMIRDGEEFDTGTTHTFTVVQPDVAAERSWTLTERATGGTGHRNPTAAWHGGLGRVVSSSEAGVEYPYYASMAYAAPENSAEPGWMYLFGGASDQHYRDPAFAGQVYRWDENGIELLYRDLLDGSGPTVYDAATAALPDGRLLVFGGDYQGKAEYDGGAYDPKLSDETWLFDPDTKRFTKIVSAESPGRRSGSQTMTYVPELGKAVLFGERLNGKHFLDEEREQEIWLFDPDTLQWSKAVGTNNLALGADEGTQLVYSRTERKLYILVTSTTEIYQPANASTAQTRLYSIDVSTGELGRLIDESAKLPEASGSWGRGGGRLGYDEHNGSLMFYQDKGLSGLEQWSYALAQADGDRESVIANGREEASFQFYAARFLENPEEWRIRWQQLGTLNILGGESAVVTEPDSQGNVSISVSYEDYDQVEPRLATLLLIAEHISDGRKEPIGFARIELLPVPPDTSNSGIALSPSVHDYLGDSWIKDGSGMRTSRLTITLRDDAGRPLPGRKLTLQDSLQLEQQQGLRFYSGDAPLDGVYDENRFLLDFEGYVHALYTDENGQVKLTLLNANLYWIEAGDHPFAFELADGSGFVMQDALTVARRQLQPSQTAYRYEAWSGEAFEMQIALDGVEWRASGCSDGDSLDCFELVSGELPDGMVLNWQNGKISGLPKSPGTYKAGIRIPSSAGPGADVTVTITVLEPLALDPTYRVWNFADRIGEPFSYSLDEQVRGGVGPFVYEIVEGSLPPGIRMEPAGMIGGTFTWEWNGSVKVRITETGIRTDSSPRSVEKTLQFDIYAPEKYGSSFSVFDKVSVSSHANLWVGGLDGIPAGSPEGAFEPYGKNQYYELIRFGSTAATEFQLSYENKDEHYKDELELYYWHPGEGHWKPFAVQRFGYNGERMEVTADVAGAEELEEAWQRSDERFMNYYLYDHLYIAVGKKEIPQPIITRVGTWDGEPIRDDAGNEYVNIDGYHFTDDAVVYVGGREALSFYLSYYNDYEDEQYGESALTAWLPPGTGTKDVVVITRGGASEPWPYTYLREPKTPAYDLQLRMKVQSRADLDALEGGNPYPDMPEHSHLVTVELADEDGKRIGLDDVLLKGSPACNVLDEAEREQCFDPKFTLTNWIDISSFSYETLEFSCTKPGSGYFLGCVEVDSAYGDQLILQGTLDEDGTFQAMLNRYIDTCASPCRGEIGQPDADDPGAEIDLVIANEDGYYGRLIGHAPAPERREYAEGTANLLRIATESLPALDLDVSPDAYDVSLSASGGRGSEHYQWYWGGASDIPPGFVLERNTGRLRLAGLPGDPETPSVKPGTYLVTIVASDGFVSASRSFTLKIVGAPERDILLEGLAVHGGDPDAPYPLSDAFAADRTSYGLEVPFNIGTLYVAPTVGDYRVNGVTVTDAVYQIYTEVRVNGSLTSQLADGSHAIPLGDGWTHVSVSAMVKQGDELLAARAYTILIDRSASMELERLQFQVSGSPEVTELHMPGHTDGPLALSVPDDAEWIVARPFAADGAARLSLTVGETVYYLTNGAMTAPIALPAQPSTPFEFKLSAPDRSGNWQERRYTVLVNRELSDDAALQQLAFVPELLADRFAGQLTLQGSVAYEQEQAELIARASHADATVQVSSNGHTVAPDARGVYTVPLHIGSNTIQVVVTAANGTNTRTYTVEAERRASRNVSLSALEAEPVAIAFQPERQSYEAEAVYDVEQLRLEPTVADSGARVQVLAGDLDIAADADGAYTVPLQSGMNIVKLMVTAADGISRKQYRLTVRRDYPAQADASDEAQLDSLTLRKAVDLSDIQLNGAFDPGTGEYTAATEDAVVLNAIPSHGSAEVVVTLDDRAVTADEPGIYRFDPTVGDHVVSVYVLSESRTSSSRYRILLKRSEAQAEEPVEEPVEEPAIDPEPGEVAVEEEAEAMNKLTGTYRQLFRIELNGNFPIGQSEIGVDQVEASDIPPADSGQWRITGGYRVTGLPKSPFTAKVDMLVGEQATQLPDGYKPGLFVYNEDTREWIDLGGEVHEGRITAPADRLGIFAVLLVPAQEAAPQDGFSDIAGHWADPWIRLGTALGLTNGYPDGTFRPQRQVSRLEFVSMLLRLVGQKLPEDAGDEWFTDMASIPKWGAGYAAAAHQSGIAAGYPDGTFRPQATITRAEMMAMLARALDLPEADTALLDSFHDGAQVPDWAAAAIAALLDAQLVNGRGDGNLAPGETATRAEVMKILAEAYIDTLRGNSEQEG